MPYLRSGSAFKPVSEKNLDLHPTLPPNNFIIKQDPMTNALYFDQVDGFSNPSKLYGPVREQAQRVLNTFWDRPQSTGILLNGEKGSGKTLLARQLSITGAEQGIPTIIINAPWKGDQFNQLIQSVSQPCIIMFDEFEKVYDSDDQVHVLTLLDGVFNSKKLFILTCNDKYRIDQHMHNRPGRIYYSLDYVGLDPDFITEYCEDNLIHQEHTDTIARVATTFNSFNFDMLKAMVEEVNRYNETPQQVLKMLNVKPQADSFGTFDITYILDGEVVAPRGYMTTEYNQSPLSRDRFDLYVPTCLTPKKAIPSANADVDDVYIDTSVEDEQGITQICLTQENFFRVDPTSGAFVYKRDDLLIIFTRRKFKSAGYYDAF